MPGRKSAQWSRAFRSRAESNDLILLRFAQTKTFLLDGRRDLRHVRGPPGNNQRVRVEQSGIEFVQHVAVPLMQEIIPQLLLEIWRRRVLKNRQHGLSLQTL